MEALDWQLSIDANDPHRVAAFWASALGAALEDNSALIESVLARGWAQESDTLVAVQGAGPRMLFHRVPETKQTKNRLHLDLHVGEDRIRPEVDRLVALGGTEGRELREIGGHWIVMYDVEGNEFCVE